MRSPRLLGKYSPPLLSRTPPVCGVSPSSLSTPTSSSACRSSPILLNSLSSSRISSLKSSPSSSSSSRLSISSPPLSLLASMTCLSIRMKATPSNSSSQLTSVTSSSPISPMISHLSSSSASSSLSISSSWSTSSSPSCSKTTLLSLALLARSTYDGSCKSSLSGTRPLLLVFSPSSSAP